MSKKYISLKEETRTVSGFSEFVHNGKESIMENDEKTELIYNKTETQNFSQEKNILIQKYKGDIKKFLEKIKSYTNENICISSLKDILSLHVDLIKSSTKNIPLIIKRIDNEAQTAKVIALGLVSINNNVYITLSQIDFNGDNLQEIYKYVLDILLRKNLVKIEKINLLVNDTLISDNYIPDSFEETNNKFIYACINENFVKKETSQKKTKKEEDDDSSSTTKRSSRYKRDEIEDDNSVLITKSDKDKHSTNKNKDNTTSLPSAIKTGISNGWSDASSSKGILKTMRDTYDTIRNNKRLDF